jgi:hypothetical protein
MLKLEGRGSDAPAFSFAAKNFAMSFVENCSSCHFSAVFPMDWP